MLFMNIHFIAVGGSVMHNLAITLHKKGFKITGSDDEIFEPAKSRLSRYGLLPISNGWDPSKINVSLNAVILGMHAREDNPELIRARELGIKIYSVPEYLYEQTKHKKRIVIAGSHGKTTVTSMIMHVLKDNNVKFDYMVGSVLEGFDTMVELADVNKIAVFEGDEYLTSPIDRRPKFHLYKPHIGLITGIAWDHMNVFPTFQNYVEQFEIFTGMISDALVYFEEDPCLSEMAKKHRERLDLYPYRDPNDLINRNISAVNHDLSPGALKIFGQHNMQNLAGAIQICKLLGINENEFLLSMSTFKGAAKRQEHIAGNAHHDVYLDFAHSPSKVTATVKAFRQQFPDRNIIACLELHTFSSLNKEFLPLYKNSLDPADSAIVFYDPEVIMHKKLPMLYPDQIQSAFNRENLIVIQNRENIEPEIMKLKSKNSLLLIMTSGNLSGLDIRVLANRYILA